ncbi:MAG TPA: DUF559 domain-containing protein [Fimbriimonadaceae bacterium]|nr:DUF559 domain-containing protein [Fimbriimonadaceae bacterium]
MKRIPGGSRNLNRVRVARQMRSEMGASEKRMWESLRDRRTGFKFKRQAPVLNYILDFYCAEALLCVETDGEQHATRGDRDTERDARLATLGVLTIRVPTLDLFEETSTEGTRWVNKIVAACEERSGRKAWDGKEP